MPGFRTAEALRERKEKEAEEEYVSVGQEGLFMLDVR